MSDTTLHVVKKNNIYKNILIIIVVVGVFCIASLILWRWLSYRVQTLAFDSIPKAQVTAMPIKRRIVSGELLVQSATKKTVFLCPVAVSTVARKGDIYLLDCPSSKVKTIPLNKVFLVRPGIYYIKSQKKAVTIVVESRQHYTISDFAL